MAIKTVRFNKAEESILREVLAHYNKDFSSCVKDLFAEKLEDLRDIQAVRRIKEGKKSAYLSAGEVDKLFED